ncbi:DNA starvation/stationary phase protection protein DpsA [Halorubrum sp. AD140]|uniref:DNA starvation/stationary phase protection protein DpsA n=1 Tax=Halorubrum sp. AD140 TaxID=3050073 RepID=UPI002ACC411B|nr:DNA starvation/stationary phase protection protein DpsA [Halorubrum sp. AD140]MDZ5812794.1 DNA starvation/stationary phase protection protein DpsA [Halorubrum sp. AD140]
MSTQKTVRQEAGTVEENALRIETAKAEQIVDALNADLANAYVLYHQLHKHHWNVAGAEFLDIHVFLQEVYEDVEDAADELAERLQALGGVPHASMTTLAEEATVEPEDENVYDIRTSLSNDLEMMGDMIESYREHVELVNGLGDYATGEMLREQLEDLEEHAHHVEHYLEDDTLVLESATK